MKKTKFTEVKSKKKNKKLVIKRNKDNSNDLSNKTIKNEPSLESIFDSDKNVFINTSHNNKDWAVNGKQIIINQNEWLEKEQSKIVDYNDPKNIPLYSNIALICMWKTKNGEKCKKNISIMKTVYDFFSIIETIKGEGECLFNLPLSGCVEEANNIFMNILSSNDNNNVINSKEEVAKFNALHPIWSFVKVSSETTINDDIRIPYISNDKNTLNDININLKEIKNNNNKGIWTMHSSLKNGYIPCMIMDFVRGGMPDEIQAIVFNKTIAINRYASFKGFRLRIVTDSVETQILNKCKNFIENDFYFFHRNVNYSNCVVRISLPKK